MESDRLEGKGIGLDGGIQNSTFTLSTSPSSPEGKKGAKQTAVASSWLRKLGLTRAMSIL